MTIVCAGDVPVTTDGGRAIAIAVMLIGIGFIAILTAAAAERFLRAQRAEHRELELVEQKLEEILQRLDALDTGR